MLTLNGDTVEACLFREVLPKASKEPPATFKIRVGKIPKEPPRAQIYWQLVRRRIKADVCLCKPRINCTQFGPVASCGRRVVVFNALTLIQVVPLGSLENDDLLMVTEREIIKGNLVFLNERNERRSRFDRRASRQCGHPGISTFLLLEITERL